MTRSLPGLFRAPQLGESWGQPVVVTEMIVAQ
jgi:hypothetical protein